MALKISVQGCVISVMSGKPGWPHLYNVPVILLPQKPISQRFGKLAASRLFNFIMIMKAVCNVLSVILATYKCALSWCQKFVSPYLPALFCRRISWRIFVILGRIQRLIDLKDACSIRLALNDHFLLIWSWILVKFTNGRTKCLTYPYKIGPNRQPLISVARW